MHCAKSSILNKHTNNSFQFAKQAEYNFHKYLIHYEMNC